MIQTLANKLKIIVITNSVLKEKTADKRRLINSQNRSKRIWYFVCRKTFSVFEISSSNCFFVGSSEFLKLSIILSFVMVSNASPSLFEEKLLSFILFFINYLIYFISGKSNTKEHDYSHDKICHPK